VVQFRDAPPFFFPYLFLQKLLSSFFSSGAIQAQHGGKIGRERDTQTVAFPSHRRAGFKLRSCHVDQRREGSGSPFFNAKQPYPLPLVDRLIKTGLPPLIGTGGQWQILSCFGSPGSGQNSTPQTKVTSPERLIKS
jgi:hypothetical protein